MSIAAQGEAPARVRALVALQHLEDREHGLAVHLEEALGEGDPLGAAVALDLALVGVELDPPEAAVGEQRIERRVEARQHLACRAVPARRGSAAAGASRGRRSG